MKIYIPICAFCAIFAFNSTNLFALNCISLAHPDSLVADTNKLWFDKSNYIIIGTGLSYKNLDIVFKNNRANLIGQLGYDFNEDGFGYEVKNWEFFPIVNQTNASINIATKYGSLGFSKAIKPQTGINSSDVTSFNFLLPIRKFDILFEYLKFVGINRIDPVYKQTVFFKDMVISPVQLKVQFRLAGRLKSNLLYVPKKSIGLCSITLSAMKMSISNGGNDFMPVLTYKNNTAGDSIIQIKGQYINSFTSKGIYTTIPIEFLVPLIRGKNKSVPKVLYLKLLGYAGYCFQKYEYTTIVESVNSIWTSTFVKKSGGITQNLHIHGQLIYDFNKFLIGAGGGYDSQSYGEGNIGSESTTEQYVEDKRINYNCFVSFRLNAEKPFGKIDEFKKKIFH
jgi:hypothetical protein